MGSIPLVGVSWLLISIRVPIHFLAVQSEGETLEPGSQTREGRGHFPLGGSLLFLSVPLLSLQTFKQHITYIASVNLLPTDFSDLHIRFMSSC